MQWIRRSKSARDKSIRDLQRADRHFSYSADPEFREPVESAHLAIPKIVYCPLEKALKVCSKRAPASACHRVCSHTGGFQLHQEASRNRVSPARASPTCARVPFSSLYCSSDTNPNPSGPSCFLCLVDAVIVRFWTFFPSEGRKG